MKVFLLLFFFLFESCAYAEELAPHAYAEEFIVIVNRYGPLAESDMGVVREVYLGDKVFAGTTRLLPINFTEGSLKDAFLKTVVGMSPREYKHHCLKKLFQGGPSIPSMGSPVDIIEFVFKEKGAVAYLPAEWAGTIRSGIPRKIEDIKIIGP